MIHKTPTKKYGVFRLVMLLGSIACVTLPVVFAKLADTTVAKMYIAMYLIWSYQVVDSVVQILCMEKSDRNCPRQRFC